MSAPRERMIDQGATARPATKETTNMPATTSIPTRPMRSRFGTLGAGLIALALLLPGCAFGPGGDGAFFDRTSGRDAVESQLSGEALAQRKYSMRRVRRDLARFRLTLEQLQRHGKASGIERFERFTRPYIERRVDPLVQHEDTVSHPELRPFHAELLLSKAILMHQMGDRRMLRQTIDRLEREFASMGSMLVLYPTGQAVTLDQGVALLRHQTQES